MTGPLSARLPDFPWDTIADAKSLAASHPDGLCDLSVGTPVDPVPQLALDALAAGRAERAAGRDPVRGDRARTPGVRVRSSRWRGVRHRFGARPTRSAG